MNRIVDQGNVFKVEAQMETVRYHTQCFHFKVHRLHGCSSPCSSDCPVVCRLPETATRRSELCSVSCSLDQASNLHRHQHRTAAHYEHQGSNGMRREGTQAGLGTESGAQRNQTEQVENRQNTPNRRREQIERRMRERKPKGKTTALAVAGSRPSDECDGKALNNSLLIEV